MKKRVLPTAARSRYTAIEAFCGPGGMSLGLTKAGFNVVTSFDIDAPSVQTHRLNLPGDCQVADVREIKGSFLLSQLKLRRGDLALFAGGPPCQGFSKQKRGAHLGDERNKLVLEYARLVDELLPRLLLFENVAIFGQKRGKVYLEEIKRLLNDYNLSPHFYNCADYGLAQTRQRFIIVGVRKDQKVEFRPPPPTVKSHLTVRTVIGGMPEPPDDYTSHPDFQLHQRSRVTPLNVERFSYVPQGGGWSSIPKRLRLPCHLNVDSTKGGWPDVYGRLMWDSQCPTITGGFDSFTRGRYGHPESNRPITPREAARLQGFPDTFHFIGTRGDVRAQIGNAVPPPLATAIGKQLIRCLKKADSVGSLSGKEL